MIFLGVFWFAFADRVILLYSFNDCEALQQLFENEPNNEIWPEGLERWRKKVQDYRQGLIKWRVEEESTLSSAFWLHVYDNDTATKDEIEAYFKNFEAREKVKGIPDRHQKGLDYVMNKMNWVNQHPCAAIWYVVSSFMFGVSACHNRSLCLVSGMCFLTICGKQTTRSEKSPIYRKTLTLRKFHKVLYFYSFSSVQQTNLWLWHAVKKGQ